MHDQNKLFMNLLRDSSKQNLAFLLACALGNTKMFKVEIAKLEKDDHSQSLVLGLHLAIVHDKKEIVTLLLKHKADWKKLDEDELRYAISCETHAKKQEKMISFLAMQELKLEIENSSTNNQKHNPLLH